MTVVNEPGLYTLILSSRKSEAKAFKRWITHEVIPTIRKTGGYMTDSLLERIQKEPAVIMEFAQALIREKNRVKALEVELNTVKPKADYPEHCYPQEQAPRTLRQTSQGVFGNAPPDTVQ